MDEGSCTGLHPYGPCAPGEGCNRPMTPDPITVDRDALDDWMRERDLMLISKRQFADLTCELARARQTATRLHGEVERLRAVVEAAKSARKEPHRRDRAGALDRALAALDAAPEVGE